MPAAAAAGICMRAAAAAAAESFHVLGTMTNSEERYQEHSKNNISEHSLI